MKWFLALVVLAVVGLVGWYGYSPIPILDQFQAAVNSGKPEAIQPFMDVDSLKKNVADYVKARYTQTTNVSTNITPDQIASITDSFVQPKTILLMMKGVKLEPGGNLPDTVPDGAPAFPIDKHYESPDVYAVDIYLSNVQTPDNRMTIYFEREGWFDWKIGAFRFAWSS